MALGVFGFCFDLFYLYPYFICNMFIIFIEVSNRGKKGEKWEKLQKDK